MFTLIIVFATTNIPLVSEALLNFECQMYPREYGTLPITILCLDLL